MPFLNGTVVGEARRVPLIACDDDQLPVAHQLPSFSDQRSIIVSLRDHFNRASNVNIKYTGGGIYDALLTASSHGSFVLLLRLGEQYTRLPGIASCASDREPLPSGSCGCKAGKYESATLTCESCPLHTTSVIGAVGKDACSVCDKGFYRPADGERCTPCPGQAVCPVNTTLSTLLLREGFWRLAPSSRQILRCASLTNASCLGGGHSGQCAEGYDGPLCAVCTKTGKHHDDDEGCIDCPSATGRTLLITAVLVAVAILAATVHRLYYRPPARLKWIFYLLHNAMSTFHAFGWGAKLRIAISWYQCVTVMNALYGVTMPTMYTDWMDVFDFLDVDWTGVVLPAECVGSFQRRLLLSSLLPLVLICLLVGWKVMCSRGKASLSASVLSALGPSLFVVFLFAPSINRKVFQTWDCEPYELSETEERFYMRASIGIRCYTAAHTTLFPTSFVLVALWPIGSLVLFAGLALRGRRRLLNHASDQFIRDIRFLHGDFKVCPPSLTSPLYPSHRFLLCRSPSATTGQPWSSRSGPSLPAGSSSSPLKGTFSVSSPPGSPPSLCWSGRCRRARTAAQKTTFSRRCQPSCSTSHTWAPSSSKRLRMSPQQTTSSLGGCSVSHQQTASSRSCSPLWWS